jgi:aspartate/methionine/tyrosine aminotransferase
MRYIDTRAIFCYHIDMNPLAIELNKALEGSAAGALLSELGRRMYFPKGIIAQAAQAKKAAGFANATIGMAIKDGVPISLSAVAESFPGLGSEQTVAYAPTAGTEALREAWQREILQKNPSLDAKAITLPAAVPGITAGISYTADLFLDEGQAIIASDPCWDNYSLIFEERRQARIRPVKLFNGERHFDLSLLVNAIREEAATGFVRVIFNFPHNPSGYTPSVLEAQAIVDALHEAAQSGARVLAICDDAYFGFFYEADTFKESLFSRLASLHDNILAVKIDGPTKEDYVWGLRLAFVTFGGKGLNEHQSEALIKKLMGVIRSSVSCANTSAQSIFLRAQADPRTASEKAAWFDELKRRYQCAKGCLRAGHPVLQALPFNSGYFMTFHCTGIDAQALRQTLLDTQGIGIIALGHEYLRVAFSSLEVAQIPQVYEKVYACAQWVVGSD